MTFPDIVDALINKQVGAVVEVETFITILLDTGKVRDLGSAYFFFLQAEDGIRYGRVTGVQTCALPILAKPRRGSSRAPNPNRAGKCAPIAEIGNEISIIPVPSGTHISTSRSDLRTRAGGRRSMATTRRGAHPNSAHWQHQIRSHWSRRSNEYSRN